MLAAAGLAHVPVVAGAAKPLLRPAPLLCAEIHGESGLDGPLGGPVLPPAPHGALAGKAAVRMFEAIATAHAGLVAAGAADARVHLVATAALTNVALLLALHPEAVGMVEVRQGGAGRPAQRVRDSSESCWPGCPQCDTSSTACYPTAVRR